MTRIVLVTPAAAGSRTGNLHTAQRWARMLRAPGHRVEVRQAWEGGSADLLIALHARRSHDSVRRWRETHPRGPLVVTLTGTDLYRDLPASREANASLALADRVIVLQEAAPRRLSAAIRAKTRVVFQSSDTRLSPAPPGRVLRFAVLGHLRGEKDPFRAVEALARLPGRGNLQIVHVGGALDPALDAVARAWMNREPRYRWLGSLPHHRALQWLSRSQVLVVSSLMEGGANVIAEAARIGIPVLASRMDGNLGMLGRGYPGFFPVGDERALARLMARCADDPAFLRALRCALAARRALFAPAAERSALLGVVREALALAGRESGRRELL